MNQQTKAFSDFITVAFQESFRAWTDLVPKNFWWLGYEKITRHR